MIILLGIQGLYAAYLLWAWYGFRCLRKTPDPHAAATNDEPFVTVVVPYRNECTALAALLDSLAGQDYPQQKVEWILVNDHSDDNGPAVVEGLEDPRLISRSLPAGETGKKAAIRYGVDAARGKWILTTDADCTHPVGWIRNMVGAGESTKAQMVCGRVRVLHDDGLLSILQDMETCLLQTAGAGSLAGGVPLLNTGASLLFLREAYLQIGGHSGNQHIASGDDTFLMLDFHRAFPGKVIPVATDDSTVLTRPQPSWKAWVAQRSRWQSKVVHYPIGLIHLIGIVILAAGLSMCGIWAMALVGTLGTSFLIAAILIRIVPEYLLLRAGRSRNGIFPLIFIVPASVSAPFFQLLTGLMGLFFPVRWKGRNI